MSASALAALIFYSEYRSTTILGQWLHLSLIEDLPVMPLLLNQTVPSSLLAIFLVMAFSLLFNSVSKFNFKAFGSAVFLSLLLESLQLTPLLPGTFDILDVYAIIIVSSISSILLFYMNFQPVSKPIYVKQLSFSLLAISSFWLSLGCAEMWECDDSDYCVKPVVLTWEELRAEILPIYGNAQSLSNAGKIYPTDNELFVIDEYRGVHVFDVSDPQNPLRKVFIPIIGATDLSKSGDYLYVNSFVDLVVINYQAIINGSFDAQTHTRRLLNVFERPRNFAFIHELLLVNTSVEYSDYVLSWDTNPEDLKGLIVGYINADGETILFGEYSKDLKLAELKERELEYYEGN